MDSGTATDFNFLSGRTHGELNMAKASIQVHESAEALVVKANDGASVIVPFMSGPLGIVSIKVTRETLYDLVTLLNQEKS